MYAPAEVLPMCSDSPFVSILISTGLVCGVAAGAQQLGILASGSMLLRGL